MNFFKKILIISFFATFLHGCYQVENKDSDSDPILLNDILKKNNKELYESTIEMINVLYNCEQIDIYFKDLTFKEKEETKAEFLNITQSIREDSVKSLNNKFFYKEIDNIDTSFAEYKEGDCSYYTDGLIFSKDKSIQYMRLFQKGKVERFDILIQITGKGVEILAFG